MAGCGIAITSRATHVWRGLAVREKWTVDTVSRH